MVRQSCLADTPLNGNRMRIKDMALSLRPREKALLNGINSLSNEELLAILIGSGIKNHSAVEIAQNLMANYDSVSTLSRENFENILRIKGINKITALRLSASFMLAQRIIMEDALLINKINNTDDLFRRFSCLFMKKKQETFLLVWLNNMNIVIHQKILYIGTKDEIHLSSDEVIYELIKTNAYKFVIIHNHPSGNINPSEKDILFSAILKTKSKKKGFRFVDHLIISDHKYFSFRDNKLL